MDIRLSPVASAVALSLVSLAAPPGLAQTKPTIPVVFDGFSYADRAALFAPVRWATDLNVAPPQAGTCVPGPGCERLWYNGSWVDDGAPGDRITINPADPGRVLIQSFEGDHMMWGAGVNDLPAVRPSVLMSGFLQRTGTWVARVLLEDIRTIEAEFGTGNTPFLSDAFWVRSPFYASHSADYAQKHASEINLEWNNFFYRPGSHGNPGPLVEADQFMADGVTFDGECQGTCANGIATGGLFMSDPLTPGGSELGCYMYGPGGYTLDVDPHTCQDSFVTGHRAGNRSKWANLMFQYDGVNLTWTAVTWDYGTPAPGDERYYVMSETLPFSRRTQPMATYFSRIMAPRSWSECSTGNRDPLVICTAQEDSGFAVDWFLYTPNTNMTIWEAESYAWWMNSYGYSNVNTVPGLKLSASAAENPQTLTVWTPYDGPSTTVREWTVTPPLPYVGSAVDPHPQLSWGVTWKYRYKKKSTSTWTNWVPLTNQGFSVDHPHVIQWHQFEMEVEVIDWHGTTTTPLRRCVGLTSPTAAGRYNCSDIGGIEEARVTPDAPRFELSSPLPNPSSGSTSVPFSLSESGTARIAVYDVLGREIAVVVDGEYEAGPHLAAFSTAEFSSGVYVVRLTSGGRQTTRTFTVTR